MVGCSGNGPCHVSEAWVNRSDEAARLDGTFLQDGSMLGPWH